MLSEKCLYCDRFITKNNLERHLLSCKNKVAKLPAKIRGVDFDPNHGYKNGTRKAWNKGLTKETNVIIKEFSNNHPNKGKLFGTAIIGQSIEKRKNLSIIAIRNGLGGHTSKKSVYYKRVDGLVVYLHSSYEVRLAKILDSLNIDWERPAPFNWIDGNGVFHRYYPDFKIGSIYIDTKNDYLIEKDREKIKLVKEQNQIDLRVLSNKEINIENVVELILPF